MVGFTTGQAPSGGAGSGRDWLAFSIDAVSAVGAATAAIVAVILAKKEITARGEAQEELREVRAQAEKAQARRVVVRVGEVERTVPHDRIPTRTTTITDHVVLVANHSDLPIYSVTGTVNCDNAPDQELEPIAVISPGDEGSVGYDYEDAHWQHEQPYATAVFRDSANIWWRISEKGELTRIPF